MKSRDVLALPPLCRTAPAWVVLLASSCTPGGPRASTDTASASSPPATSRSLALEADLLAIAASYPSLTRADGSWWAPEDCRAPVHPTFQSRAASGEHGRKLYTLFIKDYAAYTALSGSAADAQAPFFRQDPRLDAMPQVIVKEAWTPVESSLWQERCAPLHRPSFLTEVTMDGKPYRACEQAGLFIMYRPAVGTEGTDDGWVYGTMQYEKRPDPQPGQSVYVPRVTAAGRVGSCMGCHTKAPHGRLFGMAAGK